MFRSLITFIIAVLASSAIAAGCSTSWSDPTASSIVPTAPSVFVESSPSAVSPSVRSRGSPSNGIPLIPVVGSGSGIVNRAATANEGEFTANSQVNINVHGVTPSTLLFVLTAGDIGLPSQADGVCDRAAAGLFTNNQSATLKTSPGGAGAVHMVFGSNNPSLPDGASFDVVIRLVDALPPATATIDLRTPCFTAEIR